MDNYSSDLAMYSLLVSIIIPTVGRKEEVMCTLESLYSVGLIEGPEAFEVIVVEQPQDNTYFFSKEEVHSLKPKYPNLRWLRCTATNLPLARMVGLEASKGRVVLYLDDDVLVGPSFVKNHLEALNATDASAVVGRIVNLDCRRDRYRRPRVSRLTGRLIGTWDLPGPARGYVDTLAGGNMSVYSHVLREAGGFDPKFNYIALREESDVGERVKRKGGKIFYEPSAFIVHLKAPRGGCRHRSKTDETYWAKRCDSMFLKKNFSRLTWLFFLCSNVLFHSLFRISLLRPVLTGILQGRKPTSATSVIDYEVYEL